MQDPSDSEDRHSIPPDQTPQGEIDGILGYMEHQRHNEAQVGADLLHPGDLLAVQWEVDGKSAGFIFEVEGAMWENLGMGQDCPSKSITGRLQGPSLPDDVRDKQVRFVGSGLGQGSNWMQANTIMTDRSLYFSFGERREFRSPIATYFEVFRRNDTGDLRPLDPNQLDAEVSKEIPKHRQRLAHIEQLMRLFGFDDYDFKDAQIATTKDGRHIELTHEDDRYRAEYKASVGRGNQLVIFDKQTGVWMECKYFNSNNEDILQIAFADLSNLKLEDIFIFTGSLTEEAGVHRSGRASTTFVTSQRFGLEAVNYIPSLQQSTNALGISSFYTPHIQLWPDGRVEIPLRYPFDTLVEKDPGAYDRIRGQVSFELTPAGKIILQLNDQQIELLDPDTEINRVLQHFSRDNPTGDHPEVSSPIRRSALGKLGQKAINAIFKKRP